MPLTQSDVHIASFPPSFPRPTVSQAARHICQEARIVLASLRGGPPYVAHGELALGLRELRNLVRSHFLDINSESNWNSSPTQRSKLGTDSCTGSLASSFVTEESTPGATPNGGGGSESAAIDCNSNGGDEQYPTNDNLNTGALSCLPSSRSLSSKHASQLNQGAPPSPPSPLPQHLPQKEDTGNLRLNADKNTDQSKSDAAEAIGKLLSTRDNCVAHDAPERPHLHPRTQTGPSHSVVPYSVLAGASQLPHSNNSHVPAENTKDFHLLDPGPYARPFLAVVVDPRAAGPHTLVALRALHRLLERGSIVQVSKPVSSSGVPIRTSRGTAGGNVNESGSRATTNRVNSNDNNSLDVNGGCCNGNFKAGHYPQSHVKAAIVFEANLEPIARGVLSCRFEQTDAGADEAVEMAIADLMKLLLELDASGARAAEAALMRQALLVKREKQLAQQQRKNQAIPGTALTPISRDAPNHTVNTDAHTKGTGLRYPSDDHIVNNSRNESKQKNAGTMIRIQRLPSTVIMEAFHAVYVTRQTFIREGGIHSSHGGGHHSPALSFHFEQVLLRMIHFVFGGEDCQSSLNPLGPSSSIHSGLASSPSLRASLSSRHPGAARRILEFLVDRISMVVLPGPDGFNGAKWNNRTMSGGTLLNDNQDERMLCLRLVQCCLRTWWGEFTSSFSGAGNVANVNTNTIDKARVGKYNKDCRDDYPITEEDKSILNIVEDNLCLALLTIGQSIWSHNDSALLVTSSPSSGGNVLGVPAAGIPLGILSEVCATFGLLWNLPHLRIRLHSQFESIFTGFYQRALSLLRRRPLPVDGSTFEANLVFDSEMEIILESLVDILCLHEKDISQSTGGDVLSVSSVSLTPLEELFATYDCSLTEANVASGLLIELSRCCGGNLDEEDVSIPTPIPLNKVGAVVRATISSEEGPRKESFLALVAKHRPVPDHLKELCAEALLGSLRRSFSSAESTMPSLLTPNKDNSTATISGMGKGSDFIVGPSMKCSSIAVDKSLRHVKDRKRLLYHAAKLFNEKPQKGLQYMLDHEILPRPMSPKNVSSFLRNGLVVGLDKTAVGQYLGEAGKTTNPCKPTPIWEQDWFHKEVLTAYCSSFHFEHQTLLDGLRMFLAAFRLPGEAQMIDRILQAFAESCGRVCEESMNGSMKLFSTDEKRASDAAYLLSFSIIMLNTDLHNENIRPDRKMKVGDFVRNNANYGKEITDEGRDLPREYLEGIYNSIKDEQIRTLGEGADGFMTAERWKDVVRNASSIKSWGSLTHHSEAIKDLKEMLFECCLQPILSAIAGCWGMAPMESDLDDLEIQDPSESNLNGAQGARLGMDLAHEMLSGARNLGRSDIFQDLFSNICYMSGLLGDYSTNPEERALSFTHSVERQSAVMVAVNTAAESGDVIGLDCWKCVWGMIFELRDLNLLSGRTKTKNHCIINESDADFLTLDARREFNLLMTKEYMGENECDELKGPPRKAMSFVFGALFGSNSSSGKNTDDEQTPRIEGLARSLHRKEEHLIWDDLALSDIDNGGSESNEDDNLLFPPDHHRTWRSSSVGTMFENYLIRESSYGKEYTPVTGLERMDDDGVNQLTPLARVRRRLSRLVEFYGLISESRFLDMGGLSDALNAIVEIVRDSAKTKNNFDSSLEVKRNDQSAPKWESICWIPLSPASEAFAEILICEIALKNRDRIVPIWKNILCAHYNARLTWKSNLKYQDSDSQLTGTEERHAETVKLTPGIEKCVTGILRLCVWTCSRNSVANEMLTTLKVLHPPFGAFLWPPTELNLDKHLAEGLWRICRNIDGLSQIASDGWDGILGLLEWCASRGAMPYQGRLGSLAEDDPSLQAFRSLHIMLHAVELKDVVPFRVVKPIRALVEAGERGHCPKLSIAGLDLLHVLHARAQSLAGNFDLSNSSPTPCQPGNSTFLSSWLPTLEAIGEPAEKSKNGSVRQHAISMLTDALLDRHGKYISANSLCEILNTTCIPIAGQRITELLRCRRNIESDLEDILIELELCISLLFKPFLHHLKILVSVEDEFVGIWISMLGIMTQLLGDECFYDSEDDVDKVGARVMTREKLFRTTKELGSEHLRNAVMVLIAIGVLVDSSPRDAEQRHGSQEVSAVTWAALGSIGYCKPFIDEWRQSARESYLKNSSNIFPKGAGCEVVSRVD